MSRTTEEHDWEPALALLRASEGWDRERFDRYWVEVMFRRFLEGRPERLGEWKTRTRWIGIVKYMAGPNDPSAPDWLEASVSSFLNKAPNRIGNINPWAVETRKFYPNPKVHWIPHAEYALFKIPMPVKWKQAVIDAWTEHQAEQERLLLRDPNFSNPYEIEIGGPVPIPRRPFSSPLTAKEHIWLDADFRQEARLKR